MNPLLGNLDLTEREEGEIIDDDDGFEDISDNSIILPFQTGKCDSPKEHLRGISLSSTETGNSASKRRCRRKVQSGKRQKLEKRKGGRRKSTIGDSESDHDPELDKHYQKQLKAAVQIEKPDNHHNSLKARLQLMTNSENDEPTNVIKSSEEQDPVDEKVELDNELIQLRVEALRTAMINKFKLRKKHKIKNVQHEDTLSDIDIKSDTSETNKENNRSENIDSKNSVELLSAIDNSIGQDEDEDVLRAMLLASMSKKITEDKETENSISKNESKTDKCSVRQTVTLNRKARNAKQFSKPIPHMPEVKPLIIKVNSDSDSDEELEMKQVPNISTSSKVGLISTIDIQNTVDMFLKEQRAEVEAKFATNVNKTPVLKAKPKSVLIKSAVKLLPKDKQIEYQKLVQKLALAKKRMTPSRGKLETRALIKKPSKTKLPVTEKSDKKTLDLQKDIFTFRQLYKDMQAQINGRLQIQENYKPLKPDILKIIEVNNGRRELEKKVNELLAEIKSTKLNLEKSQQSFHSHVQELVKKKQRIDKSKLQKDLKVKKIMGANLPSHVNKKISEPNLKAKKPPNKNISQCSIDPSINYGDPNDIDKILNIPNLVIEQSRLSKYISPLDISRKDDIDPLGIICPFAIDGNCRDKDCSFKHIL